LEISMSYYGNGPRLVSIETVTEEPAEAIQAIQTPDDGEGVEEDLGDGLARTQRPFGW
jgi:hypothetical protein